MELIEVSLTEAQLRHRACFERRRAGDLCAQVGDRVVLHDHEDRYFAATVVNVAIEADDVTYAFLLGVRLPEEDARRRIADIPDAATDEILDLLGEARSRVTRRCLPSRPRQTGPTTARDEFRRA